MLTEAECKSATCPPDRKQARFFDGGGLYLQISPNGSKRWFLKYRTEGKEKQMALGGYPDASLKAARAARDSAKKLKSEGIDPLTARKVDKLKASASDGVTFEATAREWFSKQAPNWSESHASRALRQFERDLFPFIGVRNLPNIKPMELLATLRKIEERGAIETADRALMLGLRAVVHWFFRVSEAMNGLCRATALDLHCWRWVTGQTGRHGTGSGPRPEPYWQKCWNLTR
jgi:hypothetical protein